MLDLTDRLERMDAQGVDLQIISAWMDFAALELAADDGAWFARSLNELTIEAIAPHGDRFRAMAAVPLQAPELAAEELRYALKELGMVAVEIATTLGSSELDDPGLAPFWTAAEELDALVLVHPMNQSIGYERLSRSYFLDNIVSNPAEGAVAAANLIFGGVLAKYPEAQGLPDPRRWLPSVSDRPAGSGIRGEARRHGGQHRCSAVVLSCGASITTPSCTRPKPCVSWSTGSAPTEWYSGVTIPFLWAIPNRLPRY